MFLSSAFMRTIPRATDRRRLFFIKSEETKENFQNSKARPTETLNNTVFFLRTVSFFLLETTTTRQHTTTHVRRAERERRRKNVGNRS